MYEFSSRIRYSEIDCSGKLNLHGIVNYLQDCSTFQSESLGAGVESLHQENLVWVLSTWQIDIKKYPSLGDKVTVCTFPYEYKGYFAKRNFLIKDEFDNVIVSADSLWTLLDYKESKPVRITEKMYQIYTLEDKYPMEYIKGKIRIPDTSTQCSPVKMLRHNLDTNYHVNNGQYIGLMLDALENSGTKPYDYTRLRVEYRKMTRLDDTLIPYVGINENSHTVVYFKDEEQDITTVMELYD